MKGTEPFKKTIEEKLQEIAAGDPVFAEKLQNPNKNIDACITYILNTVQKSGCAGFTDDEVFGMAIHYYDEEKIEVGKPIQANVVVNHVVELTDEEKEQARKEAREKVIKEEQDRLRKKPVKETKPEPAAKVQQGSLF